MLPVRDLLHMLVLLASGGFLTLHATDLGGLACGAVVAYATGWAMAQYDHNYKRVRGLDDG